MLPLIAVLLGVHAARASTCPTDCGKFETVVAGSKYYYDLSPICTSDPGDYSTDDNDGHDYTFNFCKNADTPCRPSSWTSTSDYGVAVQYWGAAVPCNTTNPQCKDRATGQAVCCTRDCQILGVGGARLSLLEADDPMAGLQAAFIGTVPSPDDPFWCPWDPSTGTQFQRSVTYIMKCAEDVKGVRVLGANRNNTEDCSYFIEMETVYACPTETPTPTPSPMPAPTPSPECSSEPCSYSVVINDQHYTWDLSGMCNSTGDFILEDSQGHALAAQVCGTAGRQCLPAGWTPGVSRGVAVEYWGDVPSCDPAHPSCTDPVTGKPACCTANCEVFGVGGPILEPLNVAEPTLGVRVSFKGVQVADDDPFWCPWDATNGQQYKRTVQYEIFCMAGTSSPETRVVSYSRSPVEDCAITATFVSTFGCPKVA